MYELFHCNVLHDILLSVIRFVMNACCSNFMYFYSQCNYGKIYIYIFFCLFKKNLFIIL